MRRRWLVLTAPMVVAMLQRGCGYHVAEGALPEDARVCETHAVGESLSLLIESKNFPGVEPGEAIPVLRPVIEMRREPASARIVH